jgi:hypothetical protein
MHARNLEYNQYPVVEELVVSDEKPEWLTTNQAAEREDCPVTAYTLRAMIKRGDVPKDCYDERPYGSGTITYIDANCLADLPYREQGERGRAKREDK